MVGATPERVHLLDLLDGGGGAAGRLPRSWPSSAASPSATTSAPASSSPTRSAGGSTTSCSSSSSAAAWRSASATASRRWCGWACCPASTATTARRGPRWRPTTGSATATPGSGSRFDADSPCVWTRGLDDDGAAVAPRRGQVPGRERASCSSGWSAAARSPRATSTPTDEPTEDWPHNPNGSPRGVAGICDPSGRLFGLMPHPDAYLYPFHHPHWRRRRRSGRRSRRGRRAGDLPQRRRRAAAAAAPPSGRQLFTTLQL